MAVNFDRIGSIPTEERRAPPTEVRIPGRKSALARREPLLVGLATVIVFLAVWQVVAWRRLVPELFLPGPTDIFTALAGLFASGTIWRDLWVSGQELIYGYVLAIVIALP